MSLRIIAAVAVSFVLSACGGGGSGKAGSDSNSRSFENTAELESGIVGIYDITEFAGVFDGVDIYMDFRTDGTNYFYYVDSEDISLCYEAEEVSSWVALDKDTIDINWNFDGSTSRLDVTPSSDGSFIGYDYDDQADLDFVSLVGTGFDPSSCYEEEIGELGSAGSDSI